MFNRGASRVVARQVVLAAVLSSSLTVLSGCAMSMHAVTFDATPAEWETLGGEWHGEYWMQAYDRHGAITFRLASSSERASGDVLMISDRFPWLDQRSPAQPGVSSVPVEPRTEPLTITFVKADRGQISGRMDPYWDPDRRCQAFATFVGTVQHDRIQGTVVSKCEDDVRTVSGRWKVKRTQSTR
jgi:hypothetical protein